MLVAWLLQAFLRRYAECEAEAIAPYVVGRRLLDLGAGEGYVSAALRRRTGIWTCAVDIGRYQRMPAPYLLYDGTRLPFGDTAFDSTLISLTLHHCADPEGVLDEALRVTRFRLIILESVYRSRWERFCLERLDAWLNSYRHSGTMYLPLAFKTAAEWQQVFAARALQTVDKRWLGAWWERLVHQPALFVLDKAASRGTAAHVAPGRSSLGEGGSAMHTADIHDGRRSQRLGAGL